MIIKLRRDKMATNRSRRGERRNKKRNRNLQRMVLATVTAYLICWTFHIGFVFLKLFSREAVPECNRSFEVSYYVSRVLASSYCAVNPWMCFIFVRSFSHELKIMCNRNRQQSRMSDRKVRGESGSSLWNSCRNELRRSCSEFAQTTTLVMSNGSNHSNVSTPSFATTRVSFKTDNSTLQKSC